MNKSSQINELLTRSIESILPNEELLRKLLESEKKLRVYIGADATGPALHFGHATNFIVLERFRRLGHKVILLIGDFTARIGDPTDKGAARKQLTREEVVQNVKKWLQQIGHFVTLDDPINPPEIVFNHDWLSKLSFEDVIGLASHFTVQQMLARDMFAKRIDEKKPIYLHEFFYPLMQGFDSVKLDVDVELCGRDQLFNAMAGRILQKDCNNRDKFVMLTTLLENPVTKEKMMSKSLGTGIYLNDAPKHMFGKIMAQPDENMIQLFRDCTLVSASRIEQIEDEMKVSNPRDIKLELAFVMVESIYGEGLAEEAKQEFVRTFSDREAPTSIPEIMLKEALDLLSVISKQEVYSSKSEVRRLLQQGAIRINGSTVSENVTLNKGDILKVGKTHWFRIV